MNEGAGLSNSAEAPNTLNASPPRPATRGSSAAIMPYPTPALFDPQEMILDYTEGTDSDESVAETSGAFNQEPEIASEPEDPSPSDSGSAYEPSQTSKTNGHRTAPSKQQPGQKKPATRSQTGGTQASPKEETEQLGDSPSLHSTATKSLVNQRSGNGSDPSPVPRRNLAHKLYESRAAQKATQENESARTKQKSQNKPTSRGKIAKQPFTETPAQPRDEEEVTQETSGAKPGKLPRGKAASQSKTSSNTQKRKNKTIQVPVSDEDGDDPYAIDLELQPETPMAKQSKKVSGKSQRRKSTATQQKSATRPPGRRQASVLSEPQENSVLEIDDIEDSAMEEVDSRSLVSTRKPKLVDTMKKDGEIAAPSKKRRPLNAKPIVETSKIVKSNPQATNQNKTAAQDLTKTRRPAKSRTKASESDAPPLKARASPSIVHFDPISGDKPQESETPNAASEMCETDGESAFGGPAIDEEVHSEHDVPASADQRSITPMVEPASDGSAPVKKELPFRKRGGRRRTETNVAQENAIPREDDELPRYFKRKRAIAEDGNPDDCESKRARQSTRTEVTTHPAETSDAVDQSAPQIRTNDQLNESDISSTENTTHPNLEPPTIILSDESISSSEDTPTPIMEKTIHETVVENREIQKHQDPSPIVTAVIKQGERRHGDMNEPKALISSVGSSTSAATLVRSDALADPKVPLAQSSVTSKSYHSAQTSPHPVEIIESSQLPPPALNPAFKAGPVQLSHGFQGEAVFRQHLLPQNNIRPPTFHQNVSGQQQTCIHMRVPMDHSQSQSDRRMPGLERSDNDRQMRVHGLHHDNVFLQRRINPGEGGPKFAGQREEQPKARDGERSAVRVQEKARVLDHDDVFSPGIVNYKQNESSFVDELRRKAKARDEAEAALKLQAKAQNFTEELLRKPNRTQNDDSHGRFDVESNDRAQHQSNEIQQTLHPQAVKFGRELLQNDEQRTNEYQSSDLAFKIDGSHEFVPFLPGGKTQGWDSDQNSSHRTEYGNRVVGNETQTAEEKNSLSWQAEIGRATSGLVDTMHDITTVSMIRVSTMTFLTLYVGTSSTSSVKGRQDQRYC
ncbi:hypothetical protein KJ359_001338 [Pestalotiopsis sp. 9143b]|nr:hypothetical protein KJ359_001338 [Pestalotiopsis sp. 9143b]